MGELRQLAGILIAGALISIVGLLIGLAIPGFTEGDLVVTEYHASYTYEGSLEESY